MYFTKTKSADRAAKTFLLEYDRTEQMQIMVTVKRIGDNAQIVNREFITSAVIRMRHRKVQTDWTGQTIVP